MDALNPLADLPLGFGMALSQDLSAMERFSSLSPDQQRDLIEQTHRITSRAEMKAFVRRLGGDLTPQDLAGLSNKAFRRTYGHRAFAWRGIAPLRRNLALQGEGLSPTPQKKSPAPDENRRSG